MAIAPEDNQTDPSDDLVLPDTDELSLSSEAAPSLVQKKNYDLAADTVRDATEEEMDKVDPDVRIPVLVDTAKFVNDIFDQTSMPDIDVTDESMNWYQTLMNSFKSSPTRGVFEDILADPEAHWTNALKHGNTVINVGRPRFNNRGQGASRMSSERMVLSIRSKLGLGSPMQSPMVNSGFYATVKPLGEDEIIALWRTIIAETIRLGRVTHGLVFSNNQVYTAKAIYEAWKRNLVETTVKDLPLDALDKNLSLNDLPLIAHSLATALYPNGFPLTRSVFTEDNKAPKAEVSQILNVQKSLIINDTLFSDAQKLHMTKRVGQAMTLANVAEYKDAFSFNAVTVIDVTDEVKLHLRTPTLAEYFESGEKWINEIHSTVKDALGDDADEPTRARYISQLAQASRLRQYSHYISAVEDDGELYSTRENVDRMLSTLSASQAISDKMFRAVLNYINATQTAIIATTSVNQYEDGLGGTKWPRLIALDPISVFFQLVEQKLLGITSRSLEGTSA